MKKVLIISSTPRVNGNSEILCEEFLRGAKESGNIVELIKLRQKKIGYCIGCQVCYSNGVCFQKDDMNEILNKMVKSKMVREAARKARELVRKKSNLDLIYSESR